jgi:integrase
MRTCDLTTSGRIWEYRPQRHKTEHAGKNRVIFLGPLAQAVVKPWLRTELDAFLFQPRESVAEFWATHHPNARRRVKRPKLAPRDHYDPDSYRRAIAKACRKAGIEPWHPHQLRHSAATRLRREFGLDTARAVLGHASPAITEVYAEIDQTTAADAMSKIG